MNRQGMALLLVLWLIVLLAGVAGLTMGRAREGSLHARNRLALLQAAWAREACLEIVLGRARGDSLALRFAVDRLDLDSIDLGGGVWCSTRMSDPGEQVHLNRASPQVLERFFGDSVLVQKVLDGRPWPAPEALPGAFEPWRSKLTVRGPGRINLLRASEQVLAAVPGVDSDGAREMIAVRSLGVGIPTAEDLINRLNRSTRERIMAQYDRFITEAEVQSQVAVATVEGHSAQRPVIARMTVMLVPAGSRLAVVRREVE